MYVSLHVFMCVCLYVGKCFFLHACTCECIDKSQLLLVDLHRFEQSMDALVQHGIAKRRLCGFFPAGGFDCVGS